MSSRVFPATTGHSKARPQLCGLSGRPIQEGDLVMYLVCHGDDARPEYQIKVTREEKVEKTYYDRRKRRKVTRKVTERDYGMDDGREFRSVFNGWQTNPDTGKREKVFAWQQKTGVDADGEDIWMPVKCWSKLVFAEVAERLGYEVRKRRNGKYSMTTAHEGDRNVGNEHSLEEEQEPAMIAVARAALSDEEAGLVEPKVETERERFLREEQDAEDARMQAEQEADEHAEMAAALGISLADYRRLVAERG